MKSLDDVQVRYLVVDSNALIKRAQFHTFASEVYTVAGVIGEMKCEKSRLLLRNLPYDIHIQQPTTKSIKFMNEVSKKTGDYPSLSKVDLELLALVYDFHVKEHGEIDLNHIGVSSNDLPTGKVEQQENEDYQMATKMEDSPSLSEITENAKSIDGSINHESSNNDGGIWLDKSNVDEILGQKGEVTMPEKSVKVACITTDFAMQNVLLYLNLCLLTIDGYKIRRLNTYINRCRSCFATTNVMTKRFCSRCGNESLHRVAVTVDESGMMHLHINWQRLQSARGLKYSLPAPRGGKHPRGPQLFEDQPMPQNRMARCYQDPLEIGPFTMNDVTSRSAALGIRSLQKMVRNPNVPTCGKKRGNKRR